MAVCWQEAFILGDRGGSADSAPRLSLWRHLEPQFGQRLGVFLIRPVHFTQVFRELFELLASDSLPEATPTGYWNLNYSFCRRSVFPRHMCPIFAINRNEPPLQPFPRWLVIKQQAPIRQCQASKQY